MKLGFIGVGNMGGAILKGISNKKDVNSEDIIIFDRNIDKVEKLSSNLGVKKAITIKECIQDSDVIIIGLKPENIMDLKDDLKEYLGKKTIISMAAKTPIEKLKSYFGDIAIIRIMPNLNASIQKGITAICKNTLVDDSIYNQMISILKAIGEVVELEEKHFSSFVGIAGSSPAFVFRFIHIMALEAVKEGMNYEEALHIASIAVSGSAIYLDRSENSPEELIRMVSSPNGTTIEGLKQLDKFEFDRAITEAVKATIKKDKG